ncbi:peptidase [Lysobacteraceae bacterium NML120232]|nr:peptidase [Xanthomonadaceae bacterium NML120232]
MDAAQLASHSRQSQSLYSDKAIDFYRIAQSGDTAAMFFRPALALACLLLATLPANTGAQWLPWPPKPAPSGTTAPPPPPAAAVRLHIESRHGLRRLWLENDLHGPVQVRIESAQKLAGFPIRRLLHTHGRHLLAELPADAALNLHLTAIPGAPAKHQQNHLYPYPLQLDDIHISQLPHGAFSHQDAENRDALDLAAPIGTPVIASRSGQVMQAEDRFDDRSGQRDAVNLVRVLHEDGSMAVYAHLQQRSLQVRPGARVQAGQPIARSGNSGYSTAPHLHFVIQVNNGEQLQSVPFRMDSPKGELRLPRVGD